MISLLRKVGRMIDFCKLHYYAQCNKWKLEKGTSHRQPHSDRAPYKTVLNCLSIDQSAVGCMGIWKFQVLEFPFINVTTV